MSGQDVNKNSGFTGALGKAGLGIGSTASELKIAAPNGAGLDYCINGIAYHAADDATVAMSAMSVQAAGTSCLYLVMLDSSGTLTTKKGTEVATSAVGVTTSLQWPQCDVDKCPIGGFRVDTDGVTFTGGTTELSASGITDTYWDFALGIPNVPIVA